MTDSADDIVFKEAIESTYCTRHKAKGLWRHECPQCRKEEMKRRRRRPVAKFTIKEIRQYLEGFRTTDGNGEPSEPLGLETILQSLDDDHDGIEAVTDRYQRYQKRRNIQ